MTNHEARKFCVEILPRVSRTFAINIRVLSGDLYKAVLCAYLFCRIVDTIEDKVNLSIDSRNRLFDEYISLFERNDSSPMRFREWMGGFGTLDENDPEERLIAGADAVFLLYQSLPSEKRRPIAECVIEMTQGMKKTINCETGREGKMHTLESMADLEQYCYYVAGTVGIMLTKLFTNAARSMRPENRAEAISLQLSFANGLQITNIIKDAARDYARGWCYIPAALAKKNGATIEQFLDAGCVAQSLSTLNDLIKKAVTHLDDALRYTLLVPRREIRIRLFNLWSLFLAIKTLRKCWNNPDLLDPGKNVKITRVEVFKTLLETLTRVCSNALLRSAYQKYRRGIPAREAHAIIDSSTL